MIRDWHSMSLIKRGNLVHQKKDPVCLFFRAPKVRSRLDRVSQGFSCPICTGQVTE